MTDAPGGAAPLPSPVRSATDPDPETADDHEGAPPTAAAGRRRRTTAAAPLASLGRR